MSEVGDGVEVTFSAVTGATVTATVTPPGGPPQAAAPVMEDPDNSGRYPFAFQLTAAGMWQVLFTASGTVTAVEPFHVFAEPPSAPPLATAAQLAKVFRPLTAAEEAVVGAKLAQASRMLRNRFPDLDARIASGDLNPMVAADAAVGMVLRVARIPGALTGVGRVRREATGPFARDYYEDRGGDTDLTITDAETSLLAVKTGGPRRRGAGTIRAQIGLAPAPPYRRLLGENHVHLR